MSQQHSESLDELLRRSAATSAEEAATPSVQEEEYVLPENPFERQMLDSSAEEEQPAASTKRKGSKKDPLKDVPYDEEEEHPTITLREIIGGEFLGSAWVRRNIKFGFFLVALVLIYIANGYHIMHRMIEVKQLRDTLEDRRLRSLTLSSELTSRTRLRAVEERLQDTAICLPKENVFTLPVKE